MENTDLDATVLATRLGVDSRVLGQSTIIAGKRRTALLSRLDTPEQQASPDVTQLMAHRERRNAMTTTALGLLVAQEQDPALTATLLAPWTLASAAAPAAPAMMSRALSSAMRSAVMRLAARLASSSSAGSSSHWLIRVST
jgi:hypothetical protein